MATHPHHGTHPEKPLREKSAVRGFMMVSAFLALTLTGCAANTRAQRIPDSVPERVAATKEVTQGKEAEVTENRFRSNEAKARREAQLRKEQAAEAARKEAIAPAGAEATVVRPE